ncbi:MAG: hypothetical protein JNK82_31030 [Myxococcaceae bacterium]|nr:hypothetical protein [Myxococcaceae bacterium]
MRRALLLVLAACGTNVAPDFVTAGAGPSITLLPPIPTGPRLAVTAPAGAGLTYHTLRADGDLLAVDLDATNDFSNVYGVAVRLHVGGGTFVRAEAATSWPIFRAEGGALVLSEQGTSSGRTVPAGRLATLWFRPVAASGELELDVRRSALVGADGARRAVAVGEARWSR